MLAVEKVRCRICGGLFEEEDVTACGVCLDCDSESYETSHIVSGKIKVTVKGNSKSHVSREREKAKSRRLLAR